MERRTLHGIAQLKPAPDYALPFMCILLTHEAESKDEIFAPSDL